MSDNLIELAARCETADGPDDAPDWAIAEAVGCAPGLSYSVSLDAAVQLVPDGWHIAHSGEGRFLTRGKFVVTLETWGVEQADDGSDIHTTPDRRHGIAETFPLALCAASLRARAARDGDE